MVLPEHRVEVSSANMNGVVPGRDLRAVASGADQNKNNVGDSTLPWGRPARYTRSPLFVPFSSTQALRSRRKLHTHVFMQAGIPSSASRALRRRWSTLS